MHLFRIVISYNPSMYERENLYVNLSNYLKNHLILKKEMPL